MDTNTTSNPTAIALIEDMMRDNDMAIKGVEQSLKMQLAELARMTAKVQDDLENGFGIESRWLSEKAAKAEESIAKRRSLYETKSSLLYVMKAAGGAA